MDRNQAKGVGKKVGCGVCGCIFGTGGFVFFILWLTLFSNTCARMMGEETYPISGNPRTFDPFAALPEIRAKVGEKAALIEVEARFVKSDGTLDLKASYNPAPNASYTFILPLDEAPKDAPPIGAGRKPNDVWTQRVDVRVYEPGQRRHVRRMSGGSSSEYSYTNEGMDIDRGTPTMGNLDRTIAAPRLTTQEMWEAAIERGADKDAVANIEYDDSGYTFRISALDISLQWDKDGVFDEKRSRYPGKD